MALQCLCLACCVVALATCEVLRTRDQKAAFTKCVEVTQAPERCGGK